MKRLTPFDIAIVTRAWAALGGFCLFVVIATIWRA